MNKITSFSITLLLAAFVFSCKPDAIKPIGDENNNIAALTGTWALTKVTQTDVDATKKGFPYREIDLTSSFPYTDFKMAFSSTGGSPTTFTTTPGNSPRIIRLTSGNWSADDIKTPKVITLTSGTTTEKITLGSYPNSTNPTLKVSVERVDAVSNKVLITYSYEFTKQ